MAYLTLTGTEFWQFFNDPQVFAPDPLAWTAEEAWDIRVHGLARGEESYAAVGPSLTERDRVTLYSGCTLVYEGPEELDARTLDLLTAARAWKAAQDQAAVVVLKVPASVDRAALAQALDQLNIAVPPSLYQAAAAPRAGRRRR